MRTRATLEAQAPKFYGGVQPEAIGLDTFKQHDASKTWDDEGQHRALVEQGISLAVEQIRSTLLPEIKRYGAEQVRDGVADYISGCYVEAGIIDEEVHIAIDASNNEATFRVHVRLIDVLTAAAADALKRKDAAAAAYFNELVGVLSEMSQIEPAPQPVLRPTARESALIGARPPFPPIQAAARGPKVRA